jgi:hypothetical protein
MIFALIVAAFFIGLLEVLLRLVFPFPEVRSFNRINFSRRGDAGPKDSRYALSNATLTFESALDDHSCRIRLNRYGYRDRDWSLKKDPDKRRVAVIGDSFVEGFMVTRDESIPAVMGALLGDEYEVMNFGIGGVGIPETLKNAREMIRLFRPDDVVFLLYANDLPTPPFKPDWLEAGGEDEFEPLWKPRLLTCVQELSRGNGLPKRWTKDVRVCRCRNRYVDERGPVQSVFDERAMGVAFGPAVEGRRQPTDFGIAAVCSRSWGDSPSGVCTFTTSGHGSLSPVFQTLQQ